MGTVFRIQEEPGLLVARLAGTINVPFILAQVESILQDCIHRKIDCLLFDFTGLEFAVVTTLDRYRLGTLLTGGLGVLRKVATVANPELIDPEKFGEKVARNRGLDLRTFPTEEAARAWLRGEGGG